MELKTVTLAYFSPTGTTKEVLEGIAGTIGADSIEHIDLTRPDILAGDIPEIKEYPRQVYPVWSDRYTCRGYS